MLAPTEVKSDNKKDNFYEEYKCVSDQLVIYHLRILLGDLNATVGKEVVLRQTMGNESSYEIINDNEIKVVTFASSENLIFKNITFQHPTFVNYLYLDYSWSGDNQIDHFLMHNRRYSNIINAGFYRG